MTLIRKLFHGTACVIFSLAILVAPALSADVPRTALRNPSQPLLIYNAAGHTATVKALVYVPDADTLLSGGLDRVIHVWNPGGPQPGLSRTIRPPSWKEPLAQIYTMAITPKPTQNGERLLAFGGTSIVSSRTSFIQIYRFPGLKGLETGDPHTLLPNLVSDGKGGEKPAADGVHTAINSLSFNGEGTLLASAGIDNRIVIWNVGTQTVAHELADADWTEGGGYLSAVVLSKNGKWLWSGGKDGYLRLWNLANHTVLAYGPPVGNTPPRVKVPLHPHFMINALALSKDERTIVVAREDGSLTRYDAANLGRPTRLIPEDAMLGPVESVAIHPEKHLVGISRLLQKQDNDAIEPEPACSIEIRSTDDGKVIQTAPVVSDRVMACGFSPDGKQFAYAGGESQALHLLAVGGAAKVDTPVIHRGEGASIREVGMTQENGDLVIGFRRLGGDTDAPCEAYDLKKRRIVSSPPDKLVTSRSTGSLGAYRISPVDLKTLELSWGGRPEVLTWDEIYAGRWFSYCLIPASAEQILKQPLVAVGCEKRIIIFGPYKDANGAIKYRQTRHFRGHSGPVLAMAASADARWLVTGGTDQLLRLWSLQSASEPANLGVTFVPNVDDTLTIGEIDPDGYAHMAGLRKGDVISIAAIGYGEHGADKPKRMTEFVRDHALKPPGTPLQFAVKRGDKEIVTGTRLQDDAVVSLFITRNAPRNAIQGLKVPAEREWVIWSADGFYDTSVTADRRFLGWHRNTPNPERTNADMLKSTNFFPMRTFEDLLRRPDVINALLNGQPRSAALPRDPATNETIDVAATVDAESPPIVRVTAPLAKGDAAVQVAEASVPFQLELQPGAGLKPIPLRDLRILVDGQEVLQPPLAAKLGTVPVKGSIPLTSPGVHTVVFLATNETTREQSAKLLIDYQPPKPVAVLPIPAAARTPVLMVVSIGVGRFQDGNAFPSIATAAADVKSVVHDLFISPDVQSYFYPYPDNVPAHARPLILSDEGKKPVTTASIQNVVAGLKARLQGQRPALGLWNPKGAANPPALGDGDTLVLVVSSHVLGQGKANPRLVTFDTKAESWETQGVDTEEITSILGELVRKGCRVVTIIDGYHGEDERQSVGVREWAYRLDHKGVVVCLATDNNPSPVDIQAGDPSPFFRALLALANRGKWGEEVQPGERLTLDMFRKVLAAQFEDEVGSGAQPPYVNTPATLDGTSPLFDPPPPSSAIVQAAGEPPREKE